MPPNQDEKNAKILREQIAKVPENKRCADCTAKGPVYANTTFNTFVCTSCSGIHREFNHRVKSISMASFKPDEMKGLLEGGNGVAREKWMARWSSSDFPEPDPGDPERLRQFIRLKYLDRKWVAGGTGSASAAPKKASAAPKVKEAEIPRAEPLTSFLGSDLPPMHVSSRGGAQTAPPPQQQQAQGWASFDNVNWESAAPQEQPKSQPAHQASLWDAPVQAPSSGTGLEGFLLPSQDQVHKIEQEKQAKIQEESAKKRQNDLMSQLGSMYQQQAQSNQQQQQLQMQQQMQQQLMAQQQMMMQMAQQQGLTPQQQQLYMQQMQQMMRQFPPAQTSTQPVGPIQSFGGPVPVTSGQINYGVQVPGGLGVSGGFGGSTSPTGFGGAGASLFAETQRPAQVEPAQPPKPDPFASLSPFAGGAVVKPSPSSYVAPKTQTNNSSAQSDPFSFGNAPVTRANDTNDFFGGPPQHQEVNPFGVVQTHTQAPKQDDFNPFF